MILSGETNKVFFSAHLKADYPVFFRCVSSVLGQYGIVVGLLEDTADYWCRDYMPIQVGEDRFVKYKYSPDYLDHPASRCYVTNVDKAIDQLDITPDRLFDLADIVLDGGNAVKTPSHIIMTEKVFIENPGISPCGLSRVLKTRSRQKSSSCLGPIGVKTLAGIPMAWCAM